MLSRREGLVCIQGCLRNKENADLQSTDASCPECDGEVTMSEPLMCCILNALYRCCLCKKDICQVCYHDNNYAKGIEECPRASQLTPASFTKHKQHIWAGTIAFK